LSNPTEVRKFCKRYAFDIGSAFEDAFIENWLSLGRRLAAKYEFRSTHDREKWLLAFVCRECCEAQATGPDRLGYSTRKEYAHTFAEVMLRLEV